MHPAQHVALADDAEILHHLRVAWSRGRLRAAPHGGGMRRTGQNREPILAGHAGDLTAQEFQLLAGVPRIDMHIGRDLDLRLQHLAHRLSASRPVRRLEQVIRRADRDVQRPRIRQEVLLLDAEGIFGDVLAAGSRADHQAPFVVAQAQPEPFEYSRVQSHVIDPVRLRGRGFAARLRAGPPATAANALSGSFRLQGFAACDR